MKFALVLLALALPLHARINEKYADFVNRLGQPEALSPAKDSLGLQTANHFHKGIDIQVRVLDGVILEEFYRPVPIDEAVVLIKKALANPIGRDAPDGVIFKDSNSNAAIYSKQAKDLRIISKVLKELYTKDTDETQKSGTETRSTKLQNL